MSFAALAWASKYRANSAAEKLVLFAYADRHNEDTGSAYPSLAWLCEFTSLNRKTVIAAISKLEAVGILADTGNRMGTTKRIKVYSLAVETHPKTEPFQKRNSTEKVVKQSQKRDTDTVRTGSEAKASSHTGKHLLPEDWAIPPVSELPPQARACAEQWTASSYATHGEAFIGYWRASRRKMGDWRLTWGNRIVALHSQVMRDQKYGTAPTSGGTPKQLTDADRASANAYLELKRAYDAGEIDFAEFMARKSRPPDEPPRKFTGPRPIGQIVQRIQERAA